MIAKENSIHKGSFPEGINSEKPECSFIKLEGDGLILTSVKKALNSNAIVFQWYDSNGKGSEATLILPKTPQKVFESDFMEEDKNPIEFKGNEIKVKTKKHSVETVKVYF